MIADRPQTYVLVTTSFPYGVEGSEAAGSFVADLAESIAEHVPVRVVAPGSSRAVESWKPGVTVFRYAAPLRPLSTLRPWKPNDVRWLGRVLRGGLAATKAAMAAGNVFHVLALWGLPSGEWARRALRGEGIPYSAWMLGSDVWSLGRLPLLRGRLVKVMRDASQCYADGFQLADAARRIGNVPVDFLPSTRHFDLNRDRTPRSVPPYRLLFLGRWHPNKGIDLLLDALGQLGDEDWSRIESVRIEGGGPMDEQVRAKTAKLSSQCRPVRLGGFLSKSQAEQAIVEADWLLIPSRIESIPVIFSDAMKLTCPVVAMPVGDLPRLIQDYRVGIIAENVGASAFAQALREGLGSVPGSFAAGLHTAAAMFDLARVVVPRLLADAGYSKQVERKPT